MENKPIKLYIYNEDAFNEAKPVYNSALKASGYTETLTYNKDKQPARPRRNRQRNIIWYNPHFSKNVKTNISRTFLNLISKHFPKQHKYHSLFNKNNVKETMLMQNLGGQTKSIILFSEVAYKSNTSYSWDCIMSKKNCFSVSPDLLWYIKTQKICVLFLQECYI